MAKHADGRDKIVTMKMGAEGDNSTKEFLMLSHWKSGYSLKKKPTLVEKSY